MLESFTCGSNIIIDTDVRGLLNVGNNCINVSNTNNMIGSTVEVWIEDNDCGSGLPSSIVLTANGRNYTAQGVPAQQSGGGSALEYIYRVFIPAVFGQVCISNLRGCDDATSIALYTQRQVDGASSFQVNYDAEFHENGCETFQVNMGSSSLNREYELRVPIHEKSDDGRTVVIEATIRDGNSNLNNISRTFTAQNAGEEASLFVLDLPSVPPNADNIRTVSYTHLTLPTKA